MFEQSFVLGSYVQTIFFNLLLCWNMMEISITKEHTSLSCKRYNKENYHGDVVPL